MEYFIVDMVHLRIIFHRFEFFYELCTTECCPILINDLVKQLNMRHIHYWLSLREKGNFTFV